MTTPGGSGNGFGGLHRPGPDLIGRQLGRYEIVSWIASGGMASVYAARALGMAGFERLVALKLLHPHLAHENEFVAMFLDEARLAARIRHPNVVATLDISSSEEEGLFLVMEYIEGDHLGRLLASAAATGSSLPTPVLLRIVADALQGLGAAHDLVDGNGEILQLVHRDVSPHNLLVGFDGISRLTDFGVARAEVRLAATRDGQFKGKLGYLSPEQIANGVCDRRSDLFAMGVVLWESLAGRRLFRADDTVGMLRAVLHNPIPPIASERPAAAALGGLLVRALARNPDDRFQSAAAFLEAIEEIAPQVGGLASQRQVAEAMRRFAPPRILPQAIVPTQSNLSQNLHPGGTSRTNPSLRSALGTAGSGSGSFPRGYPQGSFPGAGYQGPPQDGSGTVVLSTAAPRHTGLVLALALCVAALLTGVGIAFGAVYLRPAGESPSPAPEVVVASKAAVESDREGSDNPAPRLLEGLPPVSPDPDLALAPTIVLRLHVDAGGQVVEARVYRSRLDLASFEEAALEAVRSYRFEAATKNGRASPRWFNWPITFQRTPPPSTILRIKGSDTIGGALAPAFGKAWRQRDPTVAVEVEALGSSTAFTGVFDGSAEIGASSRPIDGREMAEAQRRGARLQELVIGYDGVAVIVHPRNPVRNLTLDQLARIFTGEFTNWRDVGGPAAEIRLISRPASSGTHAFFREKVMRRGKAAESADFGRHTEYIEHNVDIAAQVAVDPRAISYVGLGAAEQSVRVVPIAAAPGRIAISPSAQTISDGSYPIYRPLLFYTNGTPTGELRRFLRFVLSADGRKIVERQGFVPSDVPVDAILPELAPALHSNPRSLR